MDRNIFFVIYHLVVIVYVWPFSEEITGTNFDTWIISA